MSRQPLPLAEYAREIIAHMDTARGSERAVSARDWQHVNDWFGEQIPLPIIIEAIDGCFDYLHSQRVNVARIALPYVATAVADLWSERRSLYVGG